MSRHLRLRITLTVVGFVLVFCSAASAQQSATVDVPEVIQAGETLNFTIKLDKAPSEDGGIVQFVLMGPDVQIATSTSVSKGQTNCLASFRIPPDATGGKWHIHIYGFFMGTKTVPLKSVDTAFEVIANEHLVVPSSAEVRINPSQVQLLRTAATRLQRQVQDFKAALTPYIEDTDGAVAKIVRRNVGNAIESLNATQSSFHALASAATNSVAEQVFFDDIRTSYESVLARLGKGQVLSRFIAAPGSASLIETAQAKKPEMGYTIVAQAALRSFEQNELAYKIVADTQSLTFDLTVTSNPAGAAVCYHRRGDPCHPTSDTTNTVIKSLPYAIWLVQFQKVGYRTEEREHDAFRDSNHVINADLQPQRKGP